MSIQGGIPVEHTFETLLDVLGHRALYKANETAYTFLGEGDRSDGRISYGDLADRVRTIAATLQEMDVAPGARALLLYKPGLEYIAAFLGCIHAGVIAVPAYPPRLSRPVDRLQVLSADSGASVALTDTRFLSDLERRFEHAPELESLAWLATDGLTRSGTVWRPPNIGGDSVAFLQYTSGSTAAPKGVMVTHSNLLHNSEAIYRRLGHTSRSHMVSWLPPYHDMGLIGVIIQALYGGFEATLMAPGVFLQRPLKWLEAISSSGADSAGGPNFAYELCVRRTTPEQRSELDLSRWHVAFCGAEPIRHETVERFVEAFEPCGFSRSAFYPGYGLAEATLFVSGNERGKVPASLRVDAGELERNRVKIVETRGQKARALVGCGRTLDGQKTVIVDPDSRRERSSGAVGEIWVSGPSVAQGYWGRPEETQRTFGARIAEGGETAFLRTGDLGFMHEDQLFVTGRLKDLIILRGRNHYPQDIEQTVERSHIALRSGGCAAFSVEVEGEEKLIVVAELERRFVRSDSLDEVVAAVRSSVAADHELETFAVVLIRTGTIPVTSSGKIQRRATRDRYLRNALNLVKADVLPVASSEQSDPDSGVVSISGRDRETVIRMVQNFVRRRGYTETVEVDDDLRADLGLDSLAVAELAIELESAFEVQVSETLMTDLETVCDICDLLASGDRSETERASASTGFAGLRERINREIPQLGLVVTEQRGRYVKADGKWCSDFASANYLGLDLHPEVIAAVPKAIERWGVHPSWTRAVASPEIYEDLESELADFIGAQSVLAFPTVTLLHSGVMPVLAGGDGVILLDQAAHNSMQEAAQLARARGTAVEWFDHNDAGSLERQLGRFGRYSRTLIAIDGVYSMSGEYPPLSEFAELARKYEARLYIDDAHGFGVVGERPGSEKPYGERGNGIVRHFGLRYGDEIVYVGGMSKAFSSMVAFVTCRDDAEKARLATSSTSVFSGPTPVASLASALAGLKISRSEEGEALRRKLLYFTRRLIEGAQKLGFTVDNSTSFPLVNVEIGSTSEVIEACNVLWEYGVLITPALFPAVPVDRGGLRFTITSANTEEQIETALMSLEAVADRVLALR